MDFWKTTAAVLLAAWALTSQAGAVDDLKAFNQNTNSVSGKFTQTVQSQKKAQSGSFHILRPGLFRWEYERPYRQLIVGDGKTIWLYDVDLKQVSKSSQAQTIGGSPAAILSDKQALDGSYHLKEDGSKDGIDYVLAEPKQDNAGYRFIRIGFRNGQLAAMELKDSLGNLTAIRFNDVQMQATLPRDLFRFMPPKGVDVMEVAPQ